MSRRSQGNSTVTNVPHPTDVGLNSRLETAVHALREGLRPVNTAKQMDPKVAEFKQYCELVYPSDPYKYHLDYRKVYRFMWYQAFREKKCPSANRKARERGEIFDLEAYKEIMSKYESEDAIQNPVPVEEMPLPTNPIGHSTFNIYKAVMKHMYKEQVANHTTSLNWDQIWQLGFEALENHVKERAPLVKKATYQEKINGEFAPYTVVENYDIIEDELWKDSAFCKSRRSTCTNLRHRSTLLHTTSGILRYESLYRAELSDFLCLKVPKKDTDIHPMLLMINQICLGKTNHGRTLYGRATRHRNVALCCIGAISFYLTYRFHVTREFVNFTAEDWLQNSKWFDIKFLVDVASDELTKELKNDSYGKHIRRILNKLQIVCDKLLHLGRNLGSKMLDMFEEEMEEIRRMGQWSLSVFDNSYSSKLPLGPIRKLAGYSSSNKMYFNTRTTVEPSESLLRSTPIGQWVYDARKAVSDASTKGDHQTTIHVLRFFEELNRVFLQDAAAMIALKPERVEHSMYEEIPVLQSEEFKVSCL